MWGSWGVIFAGGLLFAGLIALAFGTSIAVFGVLIALGLAAAIAVGYAAMRAGGGSGQTTGGQPRNPRSGGAPADGEGSLPS